VIAHLDFEGLVEHGALLVDAEIGAPSLAGHVESGAGEQPDGLVARVCSTVSSPVNSRRPPGSRR